MDLKTPIAKAGTTYKINAKKLKKGGIEILEDLLFYIPFRHEDSSLVSKIASLALANKTTIKGQVINKTNIRTKKGITMQIITIEDETGIIDCTFFNQPYILSIVKLGDFMSASGRLEKFGYKKNFLVKDYEILENYDSATVHTGRLVPVYPSLNGLSTKWIRNRIKNILEDKKEFLEYLPEEMLKTHELISFDRAIREIHFPKTKESAEAALGRLAFDELFLKHLESKIRKREWSRMKRTKPFLVSKYKNKIQQFIKSLPFTLTQGQLKAVDEIFSDLSTDTPMNRLLEGDVGSGKTVVATIASYLAFLNGYQSAIMAPTGILAEQHYKNLKTMLEQFGVKIALFTSSKKDNFQGFNIAIGTHALINKNVSFDKLGLVVIDEQQRFGVEQRAILRKKGVNPHFLTMTATPIPRTVFLTIYSDLALSILSELPKGRKKIKTWLIPENKRRAGYEWVKKAIKKKGSQVFIVCPLIEESENATTVKAAKKEYERLKKDIFSDFKLGLLHGQMKSSEKNIILENFKDKDFDILVTTPLVEVGIDIPNATIMLIEAAERFGLTQLHQLRGRVGRNNQEAFCFLFTNSKSEISKKRLKYLEKIYSGPELAEIDLSLRGPGDMYGKIQHGNSDLKIASYSNIKVFEKSKDAADKIFAAFKSYPKIEKRVKEKMQDTISPD